MTFSIDKIVGYMAGIRYQLNTPRKAVDIRLYSLSFTLWEILNDQLSRQKPPTNLPNKREKSSFSNENPQD